MIETDRDPILRVSRRSVVDDVRTQLVALIEAGHFRVDDRLPSENALARSFNVSRPMVREALVGLQALGLTTSRVGRGTFVVASQVSASRSAQRFPSNDLTETRLLVEVPAASMAALRRAPEHVRRLDDLMLALRSEEDGTCRHQLDGQFHICIAEATGNPILAQIIAGLRSILDEQAAAKTILPPRRAAEVAEHQAILDAIARGDAQAAGAAMETHLKVFDRARNVGGHTGPQG